MRHHSISLTIAMTIMLTALISCDKTHNQVIEFLTQLQTAHQNGDKEMIAQLYPAAADADSLVIKFDPKTVKISPKSGDTMTVDLDDGTDLVLVWQATGSLQAVASHGLFAYPAARQDFAQKTGQYKPSLNDVENAQRMADTLFSTWMQSKIDEKLNSLVKITNSSVSKKHISDQWTATENDKCYYTVTVANNTDHEIGGNDYTISVKELWDEWTDGWEDGSSKDSIRPKSASKILTGKPIPANWTVNYAWERTFEGTHHSGSTNYRLQSTLNYTPNHTISSLYDFTGNEYEEYLTTKNK